VGVILGKVVLAVWIVHGGVVCHREICVIREVG